MIHGERGVAMNEQKQEGALAEGARRANGAKAPGHRRVLLPAQAGGGRLLRGESLRRLARGVPSRGGAQSPPGDADGFLRAITARTWAYLSQATSKEEPSGLKRVCALWGLARSTVYAQRRREAVPVHERPTRSCPPRSGREAFHLLVPQCKPRGPKAHNGTIRTERPDRMGHDDDGDHRGGDGLGVRGGGSLLGGLRGDPCGQERQPLRGPGADPAGGSASGLEADVAEGLKVRPTTAPPICPMTFSGRSPTWA